MVGFVGAIVGAAVGGSGVTVGGLKKDGAGVASVCAGVDPDGGIVSSFFGCARTGFPARRMITARHRHNDIPDLNNIK